MHLIATTVCIYVGSCARPHGAWTFCADVASSAGTLISADAHGFRSGKAKRVEAEQSRQPLRHCTDQTKCVPGGDT